MNLQYRPSFFQEQAVDAVCQIFQSPNWCDKLPPGMTLCGSPYFTVELATGTDKVYTYLKTIYELHRQFGWQKYIIVVPNLALHTQTLHILQETAAHFACDYRTRAHFFSYDSAQLNNLRQFVQESHLSILVMNAQTFNVRGDGLRKVRDRLDACGSECPLELIAALRPIVILDEPQRILGSQQTANNTQQCLTDFNPNFLLGYSSRHHETYQPIFRFSPQEARLHQMIKNLTWQTVEATNELKLRRQQIRQTILTHLAREAILFPRGIKVLSLFFVDDVANYRVYEDTGEEPGLYVRIFEEEYEQVLSEFPTQNSDRALRKYLEQFPLQQAYTGYFSINKLTSRLKNHLAISAGDYDTPYADFYRDATKLTSFAHPVRFIFTHSGLHEGWENPNIFQICPLHRSASDLRRQCEIDRGLPLCVDQFGVHQDRDAVGSAEFAKINQLTVIADPDYAKFLQKL